MADYPAKELHELACPLCTINSLQQLVFEIEQFKRTVSDNFGQF
jgi:hypothetical protein